MDRTDKRMLALHEIMMLLAFVLASISSMANMPIYAGLSLLLAGSVLIDGSLREIRLLSTGKSRQLEPAPHATSRELQPIAQRPASSVNTADIYTEAPRTLLWD